MNTFKDHCYFPDSTGYKQLYGYFEIRCILPAGKGINPAFWLMTDGTRNDDTDGGITGCEIDVFETKTDWRKHTTFKDSVFQTIHIDGYKENHSSELHGHFYADKPYEKYNTYGVEWNKDEYIFYINGIETSRTLFGGVCTVPLYPII